MSGDVHVRFCERLGVQLPRATHRVVLTKYGGRRVTAWIERMLDETLGLRRNRDKTCTACLRGTGVRRDFLGFTVRGIAVDRVASGGT